MPALLRRPAGGGRRRPRPGDASFSTVALLDVGLVRHFLELGDDGSLTRDTVVDVSSDGQRVGCARKSRLLVLQPLADISLPPTQLSLKNDEVRCLQWAELQALPPHLAALLLVGGASGRLRAYTPAGALVWSAWPHASPLVRLRLHTSGAVAADLSCVYAGGIMAHVPAALLAEKIAAAAATEAEAPEAEGGGGADDFAVCELEGAAAAHDAVCAGELPPLPLDVSDPRRAAEQQPLVFLLATGGAQSALQLHLFDANGARIDARRAVVAAGRAAVGVLSGLASWGLGERAAGRLREGVGRVAAALPEAAPSAVREMSSCVRDWRDAPRVFNALALSPCRRWAAATDSLGRVLLLEARTLVVLRAVEGIPRRAGRLVRRRRRRAGAGDLRASTRAARAVAGAARRAPPRVRRRRRLRAARGAAAAAAAADGDGGGSRAVLSAAAFWRGFSADGGRATE